MTIGKFCSSIKVRLYLVLWVLVLGACLVNQEENSSDSATSNRSQHVLPKIFTKMIVLISRKLALLKHHINAGQDGVDANAIKSSVQDNHAKK